MNNIPSAGERAYQEANGKGREIAASVTDKSVAELVSLTSPWGPGEKREQVHQSVRQGCCLHTHKHTLTHTDPLSLAVPEEVQLEETDLKKVEVPVRGFRSSVMAFLKLRFLVL
ncbi:neuroglobin isoform X1 [Lates japonicus]|uniref:Neuroglobin isoform X1 n=1 Tax=Lates japonicus TaxID=270547 RepID=A0AAD3R9R0_LATJO|nr:neuroglobin isoform X1 [Lates japonicus]